MTKTVLITGATSGIGRATALALARQGHHVIATGRNLEALHALMASAEGNLDIARLDVDDQASIRAAVLRVAELTDGEGIDVLVNNAGFGVVAPASEIGQAELRAQFETNVFGLLAVTQAFVPAMRERGRGTIINISSVGGRTTLPFLGSYNATKYAVESLSDALRAELRPFGIDVVLVEPGLINTNFNATATAKAERFADETSPYATALANLHDVIGRLESTGVPPERIASVIGRVIRARRPRARYVAPFSAAIGLLFARLLPTRWLDALLWSLTRIGPSESKALAPASR